jgi:hypothetical protein
MLNSSSLSSGKPSSSSGNMSTNFDTTGRIYNLSMSPFLFSVEMAYNLHPLCILFFNCKEEINLKDTH